MIVTEKNGVTLIGGGVLYPGIVEIARRISPVLVAADGGASAALSRDWMPRAVIGDMDSLDEVTRQALPSNIVHRIEEQESTDFDKCLRNISAPFILGIGFIGGRLDHELSVLSTLARYERMPCVLLGEQDICFLSPKELTLNLPPMTRVSLFPLAEVQGSSNGLYWPIDGIAFSPDSRVGVSNVTNKPQVKLHFSSCRMLLILPREHLPEVLMSLVGSALPFPILP